MPDGTEKSGQLKNGNSKQFSDGIVFVQDGDTAQTRLLPDQINGFSFEGREYESLEIPLQKAGDKKKAFLPILTKGPAVTLYLYETESAISTFYIKKAGVAYRIPPKQQQTVLKGDQGDAGTFNQKDFRFVVVLQKLFEECPEVAASVSKNKYSENAMIEYASNYNACMGDFSEETIAKKQTDNLNIPKMRNSLQALGGTGMLSSEFTFKKLSHKTFSRFGFQYGLSVAYFHKVDIWNDHMRVWAIAMPLELQLVPFYNQNRPFSVYGGAGFQLTYFSESVVPLGRIGVPLTANLGMGFKLHKNIALLAEARVVFPYDMYGRVGLYFSLKNKVKKY